MKVIKPHRLGVLQRVVEHRRKHTMVVSVLTYVPLADTRKLLMELQLYRETAEIVSGGVIDEGFPKARGELLVSGAAYAPNDEPVTGVETRLVMTRNGRHLVDKRLVVVGNRYWVGNRPSDPVPFTAMPMDWAHAFGGEGYAPNPHGKGAVSIQTNEGKVVPLPNVEDTRSPLATPDDRPTPAGYGAYEMSWPVRMQHMGKDYGDTWLKEDFPGPARDFNVAFYNTAPADQQIDGYFRGGEQLTLVGMHPHQRELVSELIPLVVRAFATQRVEVEGETEERFVAIGTRPDTIHVFPDLGTMVVIYRGVWPVAEDDADDIVHLIVAAEDPNEPKPLSHYQTVLRRRLDKDGGALASLMDEDLLPSSEQGWLAKPDLGDMGEITRLEHRHRGNMERGRKKKLAEARARLQAAGFDVEDAFVEPEPLEIPDPHDIAAVILVHQQMDELTEGRLVELQEQHENLDETLSRRFADAGFDYDEEQERAATGPPEFSADDHLVMLHDMARIAAEGGESMEDLERDLVDPQYAVMLRELEQRVRAAYVQFAHLLPAAPMPDDEERLRLRTRVAGAHAAGESMARVRLIGADLSGLDLAGIDLSHALLEGADLSGANLRGADLTGAVLTRTRLTDTCLADANLTDSNLGSCMLERTDLTGAKCHRSVLMRSELDGVLFVGAELEDVDFIETTFTAADFSHASMHHPLFLMVDLRGAAFSGAELSEPRFVQVDLRGVDFTAARMPRAQFVQVSADGACLAGADLTAAVLVHDSSFNEATFTGATLNAANLRKTPLQGANFVDALLEGADLSACDLRGADLSRCFARKAMLMRTDFRGASLREADLLGAILAKARLEGADLSRANLSRADMSLVATDGRTQLDDALRLDTRIDPMRQQGDRP